MTPPTLAVLDAFGWRLISHEVQTMTNEQLAVLLWSVARSFRAALDRAHAEFPECAPALARLEEEIADLENSASYLEGPKEVR